MRTEPLTHLVDVLSQFCIAHAGQRSSGEAWRALRCCQGLFVKLMSVHAASPTGRLVGRLIRTRGGCR